MLLPGLVNAHSHLELAYLVGAIPAGGGFAAFARGIAATRGGFTMEQRVRAVSAADARMWADGVQAVGDIANDESAFGVKGRSAIRYRTFAEHFGLRNTTTALVDPLLTHPDTELTPHSLYSVLEAPMQAICHQGNGPLSIHYLESPSEKELYERCGAFWQTYSEAGLDCDFLRHHATPTERLVASVPADRPVLLIHNCCVTQEDIDRVMSHFTAPVYWCLCPRSNRYIADLRPPVELLRRNGLTICIGTDSLASNWSLSMAEEMKLLACLPLEELLQWATRNGAAALGWSDTLGELAVGRRPGLVQLTGFDPRTMRLTEHAETRRII